MKLIKTKHGSSNSLLMGAYGLCDELLIDTSLSYYEKSLEILKILNLPNVVTELSLLRKDILSSQGFRELSGESERYDRLLHLFPGRYYAIQLLELFNLSHEAIGSCSHRDFFLILFGDNCYFGDNSDIFLSLYHGIEQLDFGKMDVHQIMKYIDFKYPQFSVLRKLYLEYSDFVESIISSISTQPHYNAFKFELQYSLLSKYSIKIIDSLKRKTDYKKPIIGINTHSREQQCDVNLGIERGLFRYGDESVTMIELYMDLHNQLSMFLTDQEASEMLDFVTKIPNSDYIPGFLYAYIIYESIKRFYVCYRSLFKYSQERKISLQRDFDFTESWGPYYRMTEMSHFLLKAGELKDLVGYIGGVFEIIGNTGVGPGVGGKEIVNHLLYLINVLLFGEDLCGSEEMAKGSQQETTNVLGLNLDLGVEDIECGDEVLITRVDGVARIDENSEGVIDSLLANKILALLDGIGVVDKSKDHSLKLKFVQRISTYHEYVRTILGDSNCIYELKDIFLSILSGTQISYRETLMRPMQNMIGIDDNFISELALSIRNQDFNEHIFLGDGGIPEKNCTGDKYIFFISDHSESMATSGRLDTQKQCMIALQEGLSAAQYESQFYFGTKIYTANYGFYNDKLFIHKELSEMYTVEDRLLLFDMGDECSGGNCEYLVFDKISKEIKNIKQMKNITENDQFIVLFSTDGLITDYGGVSESLDRLKKTGATLCVIAHGQGYIVHEPSDLYKNNNQIGSGGIQQFKGVHDLPQVLRSLLNTVIYNSNTSMPC